MAKLTKSEFARYDPNTLTGCADRLKNIVDGLGHGADDSGSAQKNAANNFQGTAADAISEQATTDIGALHQAHDAVERLRSTYANGVQALTPSVNALREAQRKAEQNGFAIDEDWQLEGENQRSTMGRVMLQHNLQEEIDSAVTSLDQADEQVSGDISKAHLTLANTPFPQITVDHAPTPDQPPAKPDEPKPEDKPQEQGQPGDHAPGANGKPGDPGYVVPKADGDKAENPPTHGQGPEPSRTDVPSADNPPGYPPQPPGQQRDQNWKDYLNGKNADGSARAAGSIPAAYPKPEAVGDKGLKIVGAAANQQGTRYCWGAGNKDGTTPGTTQGDAYAAQMHDDQHRGFDCSGFSEYSIYQATGIDPDKFSGTQLSNQQNSGPHNYGQVVASATPQAPLDVSKLQPGDVVYYGPNGSKHVAIYVGGGVTVETNQSGTPVHFQSYGQNINDGRGVTVVRPRP